MRNDRDDKFSALALNIPPDGLSLRCDVQGARQIYLSGGRINPTKRPLVSMAVTLPVGTGKRSFVAHSELLYLTTADSEPRCVLGPGFGQLDAQSAAIISAFFADQLGVDNAASVAEKIALAKIAPLGLIFSELLLDFVEQTLVGCFRIRFHLRRPRFDPFDHFFLPRQDYALQG